MEDAKPQDSASLEGDWRWLLWVFGAVGLAGILAFVVWRRGVEPALEHTRTRRALSLPPDVEDDSDPRRFVVKLYHAASGALGKLGLGRRSSDTPTEYAERVTRREPNLGSPVDELTELL